MVASGIYIPERGDVVLLDFHPGKGSEIGKRRPLWCSLRVSTARLLVRQSVFPLAPGGNNGPPMWRSAVWI